MFQPEPKICAIRLLFNNNEGGGIQLYRPSAPDDPVDPLPTRPWDPRPYRAIPDPLRS
jgi:hypothetical protein